MIKRTDILATIHEIDGDHKARHVAYFKSIEGEDTDEKNAQGRTVKVEAKYYATLAGIAPETFRRWVRKASENPTVVLSESKQKTREIEAWHVNKAVRDNPPVVIDAIKQLPPAEQQAIKAQIAENLEPLKQGMRDLKASASDIAALLIETAESIQEARYTPDEISEIRSALDVLTLALVEAEWKLEDSK